jgi:hypothetical protein
MMTRVDPHAPVYAHRCAQPPTRSPAASAAGRTPGDTGLSKNLFARFTIRRLCRRSTCSSVCTSSPAPPTPSAARSARRRPPLARDLIRQGRAGQATADVRRRGARRLQRLGRHRSLDADSSKPNSRVLSIAQERPPTPPLRSPRPSPTPRRPTAGRTAATYCNKPDCSAARPHCSSATSCCGSRRRRRRRPDAQPRPSSVRRRQAERRLVRPLARDRSRSTRATPGEAGCRVRRRTASARPASRAAPRAACTRDTCSRQPCRSSSQCPVRGAQGEHEARRRARRPPSSCITGAIDGPLTGGTAESGRAVSRSRAAASSTLRTRPSPSTAAAAPSAPQYDAAERRHGDQRASYLYCATTSSGEAEIRKAFLGHDADYVASDFSSFNGDDAILLYEDGAVVRRARRRDLRRTRRRRLRLTTATSVRKLLQLAVVARRLSISRLDCRGAASGRAARSDHDQRRTPAPIKYPLASAFKATGLRAARSTTDRSGAARTGDDDRRAADADDRRAAPGKCLDQADV